MNNGNESIHPIAPSFLGDRGLTKREYFAVMALQGIASKHGNMPTTDAKKAVAYADALIQELEK